MCICPICQSKSKNTGTKACLTGVEEYDLASCSSCNAMYFSPMPNAVEINNFYDGVFWGDDADKQLGKGFAFAKLYLPKKTGSQKKILDVGCASGFFLKGIETSTTDWDCYGIELNPELAEHAQKSLGLNVYCGKLETAPFQDGFFDYIHLRDIVEHVTDPLAFLLKCRQLLKNNGHIYLSIPNGHIDSVGLIDFFQKTGVKARSPNGHLYFLNKTALLALLDHSGFLIESSGTYGIKHGLRMLKYLPRKRNWMHAFDSRLLHGGGGFSAQYKRERPKIYHIQKMIIHRWLMWRGLVNVGLDFELILRQKADR